MSRSKLRWAFSERSGIYVARLDSGYFAGSAAGFWRNLFLFRDWPCTGCGNGPGDADGAEDGSHGAGRVPGEVAASGTGGATGRNQLFGRRAAVRAELRGVSRMAGTAEVQHRGRDGPSASKTV